ncbi:MAG: hypothetical protein H6817_02260 [Phycisphaerales bacterium]|nr:hypothetical protein [Phycisphaerales bacterium]
MPDDELKRLEGEVSDLLSQAEELSNQLADEVGSEQASAPAKPADDPPKVEKQVEEELAAADSAINAAASEIGSEPAPTKKPKRISLPRKQEASAGTAPAQASAAPQQEAQRQAAAPRPRKPLTLPGKRPAGKGARGADRLVAGRVNDAPFDLEQPPSAVQRLKKLLPTEQVGRACTQSANVTARALEWMDRPFHFLGYRVRTILGWVAVVMLTAAISLLFFVVM